MSPALHPQIFEVGTRNPDMLRQVEYAQRLAPTSYPVLIHGESGTGKELFARGIHAASGRRGPFVPLNCGAIPENLFEAELFGARRGAYTGLAGDRPGLFRLADGGTLFLDEIAEIPLATQAKLLRVLQDGEFRPLGAAKAERADVRIVAATHKELGRMVEDKQFRLDLYYRVSAACVRIPPLRDRPEDLGPLIDQLVVEAARAQGRRPPRVTAEALAAARRCPWPGNVRQLAHAVAIAVLAGTDTLGSEAFASLVPQIAEGSRPHPVGEQPFFSALGEFERGYLRDLLDRTEGNLSEAARLSQLSRSALRDKARHYGLLGDPTPGPEGTSRSRVRRASKMVY